MEEAHIPVSAGDTIPLREFNEHSAKSLFRK